MEFLSGFVVGVLLVGLHYWRFRAECLQHIERSNNLMDHWDVPEMKTINGECTYE